jgi:hypothetical protein
MRIASVLACLVLRKRQTATCQENSRFDWSIDRKCEVADGRDYGRLWVALFRKGMSWLVVGTANGLLDTAGL